MNPKELIARRVAKELKDGDVVNLGIGLPTMVSNYVPKDVDITFQSENGMLGLGPAPEEGHEDWDLTNAGGKPVTMSIGGVCFDSSTSFGIIRGGHVDATVLGSLEVDEEGSISNWIIPGKMVPGMGGAMDLLVGAKKVIEQVVRISQALLERLSIPQVAEKKELLLEVLTQTYWNKVNVEALEHLRNEIRYLIQYITDEVGIYSTDFKDDLIDQGTKDVNIIDFKTYEEKVIDYLLSNEINETIIKIKMMDKITSDDLKELERILWQELGTKDDYFNVTKEENLAVFIRSIVGIEQEAINEKFSEYLNTNILSAKQQEFVKSIINYVQQNGDITKQDLVDKSPFSDFDVVGLFNDKIDVLIKVINNLHESILVA